MRLFMWVGADYLGWGSEGFFYLSLGDAPRFLPIDHGHRGFGGRSSPSLLVDRPIWPGNPGCPPAIGEILLPPAGGRTQVPSDQPWSRGFRGRSIPSPLVGRPVQPKAPAYTPAIVEIFLPPTGGRTQIPSDRPWSRGFGGTSSPSPPVEPPILPGTPACPPGIGRIIALPRTLLCLSLPIEAGITTHCGVVIYNPFNGW